MNQNIINAKIRNAARAGELPYSWCDPDEKRYRQIAYTLSKELGIKLTCKKIGDIWTLDIA